MAPPVVTSGLALAIACALLSCAALWGYAPQYALSGHEAAAVSRARGLTERRHSTPSRGVPVHETPAVEVGAGTLAPEADASSGPEKPDVGPEQQGDEEKAVKDSRAAGLADAQRWGPWRAGAGDADEEEKEEEEEWGAEGEAEERYADTEMSEGVRTAVDEREIEVYRDPTVEWGRALQPLAELQPAVAAATERGFGVVVLVYGRSNLYMSQAVVLLKRLHEYYPAARAEVVVDAPSVRRRRRQLAVQHMEEYAAVRPLVFAPGLERIDGHLLKPVAIMSSSFRAPLFLDTDTHPCPLSLGLIARGWLAHNYTFMADVAQAPYHATFGSKELPLSRTISDARERARWERTPEVNSGVLLLDRSDAAAATVLLEWARECVVWVERWAQKYSSRTLKETSDQGALRIALFRHGESLRRGFSPSHEFVGKAPPTGGQPLAPPPDPSTLHMQCPVFLRLDEEVCRPEHCLFKHGSSYKFGSSATSHRQWRLRERLNSLQEDVPPKRSLRVAAPSWNAGEQRDAREQARQLLAGAAQQARASTALPAQDSTARSRGS